MEYPGPQITMGKRSFDPTTVAARQLEAKKKQAHRIRLKKQLERAHKKLEAASTPSPNLASAIDDAVSGLDMPAPRVTSGPHRPNPVKRALNKREERQQLMSEAADARDAEIREREKMKARQRAVRERTQRKLMQTTKRGQPKLAKHIDVLLEKIQKGK